MENWDGNYYNYYRTDNCANSGHYASTVDNGWLAAGLIVAKQAFPDEIGLKCKGFIDAMNFKPFYDKKLGHMALGFDHGNNKISQFTYGLINTEPRLASYIAIAKGDVPVEHWFRMDRTLPRQWKWQQQVPKGSRKIYAGYKVFEGYYKYKDFKYVPSWAEACSSSLCLPLCLRERAGER